MMETQYHLASLREQVGSLLQDKKLIIAAEILVVLLIPAFWGLLPVPRTIIPLLLLGWLSLWLRRLGWRDVGFRRPQSWLLTAFAGIVIGALVVLFSKVILPILLRLMDEPYDPSSLSYLRGNLPAFLVLLAFTWPLAAIGEEIVYRGYVLNRLADLFGRSKMGWGISIMLSALMFSLAHGVYDLWFILITALYGLLLGGLYLISRCNLSLSIIVHGVGITITTTLAFLGVV